MNLNENIIRVKELMGLFESKIPSWFKRRANKNFLQRFIKLGMLEYPLLCYDFVNPEDYSDSVIESAVDYLIQEYPSIEGDFFDEIIYPDTKDFLLSVFRKHYEEELIQNYNTKCTNSDKLL